MSEKDLMIADMVKDLAILLMEQNHELTMEQSLATVFNSDTYQKILNEKTTLYYQSPRYVFSFLDNELKSGRMQ
ncbi:MAG: hypothetical protein II570_11060 [Bacteroidaceae bacterium]|jgi:hypothetical protein|nr:hypothetical protein [Bacteroidaceae bacterium]MBQ2199243.1 hypothetical protein [Bacteroidaceae bacterium]MBQ2587456.1 hypothetical protein [Bacteroidaceae bacterium]